MLGIVDASGIYTMFIILVVSDIIPIERVILCKL